MVARATGQRLAVLCDRLHRLAHHHDPVRGPSRGRRFELLIEERLLDEGFPIRAVPGGLEVFGVLPASGLRHQIDAEIAAHDADVVGEWKAYMAPVPKNELLLFKAKTDDLYEAMVSRSARERPVIRLFGMMGDARPEARAYAARHGIVLVERGRWPAPVLSDELMRWPNGAALTKRERWALLYLSRPLQEVYGRTADGRLVMPRPLPEVASRELMRIHDRVSARLTACISEELVA